MPVQNRRMLVVYAALVLLFWVVICRLFLIASEETYVQNARTQTVTTLRLAPRRGNFYDRNLNLLTGTETAWYALCVPGESSYTRLFDYVAPLQQKYLYQRRNAAAPFLIRVDQDLTGAGVFTVAQPQRYAAAPLCMHLIGYLDEEGHGVSGLEYALDDILYTKGEPETIQCVTNARGALMQDTQPVYRQASQGSFGVQLTIDRGVQAAAEGIGAGMLESGCILVLDTQTAQVLASASFPSYTPDTVAQSIRAENGALMNRATAEYAVGSVFKPVLAAAALEQGLADLVYECPGYIQVNGHVYRCAGGVPHGTVDLAAALEKSCNGYFVTLGRQLGAETVSGFAASLGFGRPLYIAGGMRTAAGNLPDAALLQDVGELANLSFGQGALLATPVQIAAMMNAIAFDGAYRLPGFVLCTLAEDTGQPLDTLQSSVPPAQVMSEKTAGILREMLIGVVQNGIGRDAQPVWGDAGGKTGTAQTGRRSPDGTEYKNLWFAGFYPQDQPRYTIVVLQDDQTEAQYSSAAVFSRICDALALLDDSVENG